VNASSSLRSNNFSNLLQEFAYSIGSNLFAPIFYAGELRAEVDRNESLRRQRLNDYGQILLIAFQEVEDALILEQKQRENITNLQDQIALTRDAYEQLRLSYFNGVNDYLDVLTALNQTQQLQRDLLRAQRLLLDYRITLYRALAGGFESARPAPAQ